MGRPARRGATFYQVLSEAVAEMSETGFDSSERLAYWIDRIRKAAIQGMVPLSTVEHTLNEALRGIFKAKIERGGILKLHPEVSRFTLRNVQPRLRGELERRMMASRELIKLNRAQAIDKTVQRFSGWATSIPPGGSDAVDGRETKTEIRKALASLPFTERRCLIDQGHKFTSNLSNIIAVDGGALAAEWHSNFRQRNYNYREEHKERDGKVYVIRDNWALSKGLMTRAQHEYTDDVTMPGEEIFCRCHYRYIYSLRRLPPEMVTTKGRAELERVKVSA